jgi:hypothetical protein
MRITVKKYFKYVNKLVAAVTKYEDISLLNINHRLHVTTYKKIPDGHPRILAIEFNTPRQPAFKLNSLIID